MIKTIRWNGTCKKCGAKSYFVPVKENGNNKGLMCIICFLEEEDE